jgi:hypothetical protein
MISVSVDSRRRCELPSRPGVQVLVGGRLVRARQGPFALGAENVPRRVIRPGRGAWALVRFANYCGRPGVVSLRITIGGRSVTRAIPNVAPPVCGSRASPPSLGVSLFVRR